MHVPVHLPGVPTSRPRLVEAIVITSWFKSQVVNKVHAEWGDDARTKLGPRLYEALLHERLAIVADAQDSDEVSDEAVRRILGEGREFILAHMAG